MHINGWQRLWLVAAVLWAVAVLSLGGVFQFSGDHAVRSADMATFLLRLWSVPVAAVYVFGAAAAWVRRGFQSGQSQSPAA